MRSVRIKPVSLADQASKLKHL